MNRAFCLKDDSRDHVIQRLLKTGYFLWNTLETFKVDICE